MPCILQYRREGQHSPLLIFLNITCASSSSRGTRAPRSASVSLYSPQPCLSRTSQLSHGSGPTFKTTRSGKSNHSSAGVNISERRTRKSTSTYFQLTTVRQARDKMHTIKFQTCKTDKIKKKDRCHNQVLISVLCNTVYWKLLCGNGNSKRMR